MDNVKGPTGTVKKVLEMHDVSDLVGFRVCVTNAAEVIIDQHGNEYIEVPETNELLAAAAMVRCLMAVKLRGPELRAIRHIMGWKASELAKRLDARASPETVSRWESGRLPMGAYAEKVFRLNVCEELKSRAPGIEYKAGDIARLTIVDPWMTETNYEVPPVILDRVRMRTEDRKIARAYIDDLPNAA